MHRGMETLEKCCDKRYYVILHGHMIPDPDGMETLKHITVGEGTAVRKPAYRGVE